MKLAASLLLIAYLLPSPALASEPVEGTASIWSGPGAATHDCHWPWDHCAMRRVTSLQTGVSIIVTPDMYCDCYVGRVGPNGETERLIDLDPAQVRALGLDPGQGLFPVDVELLEGTPTLPNTATSPPRKGAA